RYLFFGSREICPPKCSCRFMWSLWEVSEYYSSSATASAPSCSRNSGTVRPIPFRACSDDSFRFDDGFLQFAACMLSLLLDRRRNPANSNPRGNPDSLATGGSQV